MMFCFLLVSSLRAQEALDRVVSITFEDQSPAKALQQLRKTYDLNIVFSDSQLPKRNNFPLVFKRERIRNILNAILANTGFAYQSDPAGIIITRVMLTPKIRSRFTIQGIVAIGGSAETLMGTNIFALNHNEGTHSNEQGIFSLTLPQGRTRIGISFVGFHSDTLSINLQRDTFLRVVLHRESQQIEGVVIPAAMQS